MAAAGLKDLAFITRIHMKRLHFMKIFETTYTPGVLFHSYFYFFGLKLRYEYFTIRTMKNWHFGIYLALLRHLLILQMQIFYSKYE